MWVLLCQLSQVSVDPISGGAGWVGAGLLGSVLSWLLLYYLPKKDAQIVAFMDTKDRQIINLMDAKDKAVLEAIRMENLAHVAIVERICKEFERSERSGQVSCEKNFEAIAKSIVSMARKSHDQ